jgi:phosphoribosyl 1,2-cyclic phosphate phosphodiesterase
MGSGTSHGIPMISCSCPVCNSRDLHDKRYRSSVYVKGADGEDIVIDCGPEFRLQALRAGIKKLDLLLLTHSHADHLHGLDDVRPLTWSFPLPIYANKMAIDELRSRFSYIWEDTQKGGGKPHITACEATETIKTGNIKITPLPVRHGCLDILGWLFEENGICAAYITDCSYISESTLQLLSSVSVLILGALRLNPHPTHFNFNDALTTVKNIQSPFLKQVFFTHISHEHSHKFITNYCKEWCASNNFKIKILPAFDGMEINI